MKTENLGSGFSINWAYNDDHSYRAYNHISSLQLDCIVHQSHALHIHIRNNTVTAKTPLSLSRCYNLEIEHFEKWL